MTKSTNSVSRRKFKKAILLQSKGYYGRAKNCFSIARDRYIKSLQHKYVGRKQKKRFFRTLWIQRLNAFARSIESVKMNYSKMIFLIKNFNNCEVNNFSRKVLSEMAIHSPSIMRQFLNC